jgi:sugar phosphate isomerase/epimerase
MFRTAFSTVACPDWTLARVARGAADLGYDAVELRTFGSGSTRFACDPALTDPAKTRRLFADAGVAICSLATSVAFDEPIRPPVIGRVKDTELSIRKAKSAIDLAAQLECPLVRVFGFEFSSREKRASGLVRVAQRLALAADAARNTGVKLVVENGGSFATAAQLLELIDAAGSPLVGAAYSHAVAADAGEDPAQGVATLGARLWCAKLRDRDAEGTLRQIGEGTMNCAGFVRALAESGFRGPAVVEWDRAWIADLEAPDTVLPRAIRRLYEWSGIERITTSTSRTALV